VTYIHSLNCDVYFVLFVRERNELLEVVAGLKQRMNEMTHREEDAYQQMKKSVALVEQAQLEQTQEQ